MIIISKIKVLPSIHILYKNLQVASDVIRLK